MSHATQLEPVTSTSDEQRTDARSQTRASSVDGALRAELALQSMGNAVVITDAARIVTYLNREAERLTGWMNEDASGRNLDEVLHLVCPQTRERLDCSVSSALRTRSPEDLTGGVLLLRRDRSSVAVNDSAAPLRDSDGNVLGMVVLLEDVTQRRRVGRRLFYEATHDALTGLLNRREFERRLSKMLRVRPTSANRHALILLDLDRFKLVNDSFGHDAGDELLRKIAALLRGQVRRHDVVGRIGGDEFGALLENCPPRKAAWIAEQFRASLAGLHFIANGSTFALGASVGLLYAPVRNGKVADLMRAVDSASYKAKRRGGNSIEITEVDTPDSI